VLFRVAIAGLCAALAIPKIAQPQQNPPREHFANAAISYDWVSNSRGDKLRTFITRPKNTSGKVPVIFFVGWLSCDSVEYPKGETDGFDALMRRLIDQSGYATVRMDKPGVGESQGTPATKPIIKRARGLSGRLRLHEQVRLHRHQANFRRRPQQRRRRRAARLARSPCRRIRRRKFLGTHLVRAHVGKRARPLDAEKKSPAEVNDAVKAFTQFYDLYLIQRQTPGEALRQHPEWKAMWYDEPDGQYGRPASFYQQLQALNLGQLWQKVEAPVLVIHGSSDTIMSRADSFRHRRNRQCRAPRSRAPC